MNEVNTARLLVNKEVNSSADQPPLVTVAMSVLNGGTLLEYAVRSVLNQSWPHWELLLLDDGSTDGVIERLRILNDPRIKVICDGLNMGLSSRLNQAVAMAKGKYFARMDHDDISHPERLARQVAFLEANPKIDLLAAQCVTMDEQGNLLGELPYAISHADICRRPWQGFYMAHPSWMGRTTWFRLYPYSDPAPYCCEDQELLLRAHYTSCFHTYPERLLAYRVRTQTPWKKLLRTRVAMGRMQFQHFLSKRNFLNALRSKAYEVARIGMDALRVIFRWWPSARNAHDKSKLDVNNLQEWQAIISMTTSEANGSNSSDLQTNNGV